MKGDVKEHGNTVRCPGCISILRRTARQEHSDACRRRLEKKMEGTQRAKNAKAKMRECVDKKMQEGEHARKKKKDERGSEAKREVTSREGES